MKFFPNLIEPSFFLTLPGMDLTVTEKETVLFKGRVLFGQRAGIGNDALKFTQVHYWSGLAFVRHSGTTLVYFGFLISSIGAFFIYFLIPKKVFVTVKRVENDTVVNIGGHAGKYPVLFADEFEKIGKDIRAGLRGK